MKIIREFWTKLRTEAKRFGRICIVLCIVYRFLRFSKCFYFPNIYYVRKVCNHEEIWLWDFDILIRFQISWINLCCFYGDVCMCVCARACVYVCKWVNTIASKRYIRLRSNLVCTLQVSVGRTLLILVNIGWIVFFTGVQKRILIHYGLWSQIL